jgi:DNA-binding transcriptional LysR family regulator
MDVNQARTFLEIIRLGSFGAAAVKLNVTQTTVTARVHNLENQLGCRLFIRNRSGATTTLDGEKFIEHAVAIVQAWEGAKRNLPLPTGTETIFNIAGEISLWSPLMLQWLNNLSQDISETAINAEIGERTSLHHKLQQGLLDVIVVHQPEYGPGIQVEQVLEEKLIFVSSKNKAEPYIYVDWGEYFRKQHDIALPHLARPKLTINLGQLALQHILENGGSGYFRTRVVQKYLHSGDLIKVDNYPEFTFPVYMMHKKQTKNALFQKVLNALFKAGKISEPWL